MDTELLVCMSQVTMALQALLQRKKRLDRTTSKLSRHYSKLAHTRTAIALLEEFLGMLHQDPDHWDDEPDIVPF